MRTLVLCVVIIFSVCQGVDVNTFFTTTQSGDGTYYGGVGSPPSGGACGIAAMPAFAEGMTQVAMNGADYVGSDQSQGCAMCVSIWGTGTGSGANPVSTTPKTYFVTDKCPGCAAGDIDLTPGLDGRWGINWKAVDCPVGNTPIQYRFIEQNNYYIKMQIVNHRLPVKSLSFILGGTKVALTRTPDNYWECPSCSFPVSPPFNVELTSIDGNVVTDSIPSWFIGTPGAGSNSVQFPTYGGSAAPTPTTPTGPVSPSPSGSNTVADKSLPASIPSTGTINGEISYVASVACVVTMDVVQGTTWITGDHKDVQAGTGSVAFSTPVSNLPTSGIKLKGWIVPKAIFDADPGNAWQSSSNEFLKEVTVTSGTTTTGTPTSNPTPSGPTTPVATYSGFSGTSAAKYLEWSIMFYEAQRTGKLPANNRISWRGDTFLQDGSDNKVDLAGGYFDAGDHYKFMLPMTFSMTTLAWGAIEYQKGYEMAQQWTYIKDAIRWGTDYILKSYDETNKIYWGQVGGPGTHDIWKRPEDYTADEIASTRISYQINAQSPGADLLAESAAALAAASIVFKTDDAAYSTTLLNKAKALYAWADSAPDSKYSDVITQASPYYTSYSGGKDELCLAAAFLYRATNDQTYLDAATGTYWSSVKDVTGSFTWDNVGVGAKVLLALVSPSNAAATSAASAWANSILTTATNTDGLIWFDVSQWGSNRHAMNSMFPLLVYLDKVETDENKKATYEKKAIEQMNYIFGNNNVKVNYMVGADASSPKRAHHRGSASPLAISDPAPNPQVLYGALVGGPGQSGDYADSREDYVKNEVALDYNAGFTGNLARFVERCTTIGCSSSTNPVGSPTPSGISPSTTTSSTSSSTTSSTTSTTDTQTGQTDSGAVADNTAGNAGFPGWAVAIIVIVIIAIIIGVIVYLIKVKKVNELV